MSDPSRLGEITLHEIVRQVLLENGNRGLTSKEVAEQIRIGNLWRRPSDDAPPRASQIRARVREYPSWFRVDGPDIFTVY